MTELIQKKTALVLLLFVSSLFTVAQSSYKKTANGIELSLAQVIPGYPKLMRVEVVSEKIFHVLAAPDSIFHDNKSLMVVKKYDPKTTWQISETPDMVQLRTSEIIASVSLSTGRIVFTDKNGNPLLAETKDGGKTFTDISVDGSQLYSLKQRFQQTPNEAFYGLGQHQNGVMNYWNSQVELLNYNADVAVPFLVSSNHYGILWDNYSITQVMDSRPFEQLSAMKLFSATGEEGWLTATYFSKKNPSKILIQRAENTIDYNFIPQLKNFPDSLKMDQFTATWEGNVASDFTGTNTFFFRYGGYAKIWIDGQLLADRWRHSWNPGTALLKVEMVKGKKYSFKIQWNPDSGESYIGCKWLKPLSNEAAGTFSFASEAGRQIDYYMVSGADMDEVISGYRQLTGKATIVPKWAMGFWQSRERYKTQADIINTVAEFRKRQIPLDNIVEDWSYWKENQWGSHDFDTTRFPDAAGMIKELHNKYHTQFMISVWPKFYEGTDNFKLLNEQGFLYTRNIKNQQRDWIGKGYINTFYDAYNPEAGKAFWKLMKDKLYSKGVDAWWMDASEPDIHSNLTMAQRKTLSGPTALGSSTEYFNGFALQNSKAVYEGQRQENPDKRVFILTRSAYGGMQRYAAATWSGDIAARWEDFKNQIPAGINFGLSGMPYWTTDIGGFAVERRYEKPTPADKEEWKEQSTRWYQFGAFCPLFRVHGQFPFREIYNIASEDEPAYKSMLYYNKLRYRLMPYIYALAQQTYHDDYTIVRGLPMDFADDELVKNIGDQFMFGPAFLVNPVTGYKARNRKVYLPKNTGWYNFYDGSFTAGGNEIVADAPYEKMPLFIKAGSIIPTGPAIQFVAEKPVDPITIFVYTGADGFFKFYEDQGIDYGYEKGAFSLIELQYNDNKKTLTIGERTGKYPGMLKSRTLKIVWVSKEKPAAFDPDAKTHITIKYNGSKIIIPVKF